MIARRWTVALWVLAGFFALILLLKFFVADIYRVDSGSMRPTISPPWSLPRHTPA